MDAGVCLDASRTAQLVAIDVLAGISWPSRSGLLDAGSVDHTLRRP
jgi:hypothetical protein